MKQTFSLVLSLLLCPIFTATSQTTKEEMYANIDKTASNYFAYSTDIKPQVAAPKGYEPFYISHYGRHIPVTILTIQISRIYMTFSIRQTKPNL